MLLMVLVIALILMALYISQFEITLAFTNRRTASSFHAAGGGSEVAIPVIQDTIQQNALPTYIPPTVVVDATLTGLDPTLPDFLEEITMGGGPLATDDVAINPDLTITALNDQIISVDIDYEGPATLPGSELEEFAARYHKKTGGVGCASGTLYYIESLASGPMQTQSRVRSAYFDCF